MSLQRLQNILARDIMVRNVIVANESTKIRDIERQMIKQGIGGLPVVREQDGNGNNRVIGMITHRDILLARHSVSIGGMDVKDLMSHDITTVKENATLVEILSKMAEKNVERLPVVNDQGSMVGMIMHKNILASLLDVLKTSTD
nr:CBS domain-containing protein [Candidatus Sigynarchaeota archaeon]